jgi:hypothetical protein
MAVPEANVGEETCPRKGSEDEGHQLVRSMKRMSEEELSTAITGTSVLPGGSMLSTLVAHTTTSIALALGAVVRNSLKTITECSPGWRICGLSSSRSSGLPCTCTYRPFHERSATSLHGRVCVCGGGG